MQTHFDEQTLLHYQNALSQLDPKGNPTAQLIYDDKSEPMTKVGILDASFNPMTLAHESLTHISKEALTLDKMVLMLSGANVDKTEFGASLVQRLAMLVCYAKQHKNYSVAICSHARFVDKVTALKTCYKANVNFYFIVGFDTLVRIFDPKYYTDMHTDLHTLFETCHFIAANRGSDDAKTLNTYLQKKDVRPFAHKIHPISLPKTMANISSTAARTHIKQNLSIDHLVPNVISQAIKTQNLYLE